MGGSGAQLRGAALGFQSAGRQVTGAGSPYCAPCVRFGGLLVPEGRRLRL